MKNHNNGKKRRTFLYVCVRRFSTHITLRIKKKEEKLDKWEIKTNNSTIEMTTKHQEMSFERRKRTVFLM